MPSGPTSSGSNRFWTDHERTAVIRGMARYGHNYTQLATLVPPRTAKAVERYIDRHALHRNSKLDEESDEGSDDDDHDVVDDDGTNGRNWGAVGLDAAHGRNGGAVGSDGNNAMDIDNQRDGR